MKYLLIVLKVLIWHCPANTLMGPSYDRKLRWCKRGLFHKGAHEDGKWGWSKM